MLTSADRAFGIIAVQRKLITQEALAAEEKRLEERHVEGSTMGLAQHLIVAGLLDANQRADVERIRSKHGRPCEGCQKTTFMLPGESPATKPCEHCGGKLSQTAPAPAAKPTAPPPAARPATPAEVRKVTGKIERSVPRGGASETPASAEAASAAPKSVADSLEEAQRNERARKLRMGAAFGYEPPPAASAPATAAAPPTEAAPAPMATPVAPPPGPEEPYDPAPAFSRARPGGPIIGPAELIGAPPPAIPTLPYSQEAKTVLLFPFKPSIVAVLTIGAVVGAIMGVFNGLLSLLILLYYTAWQVKVTNHVTNGKTEDIPDWPDVGEVFGLGWRLLLCNIACLLPAIFFMVLPLVLPQGRPPSGADVKDHFTMGEDAAQMAGRGEGVIGNDVSDEEFFDKNDLSVKISDFKGKWLVLGLIDADDSTDSAVRRGISTAEVFDLDRLARADDKCTVVGVLVDPGQRRMKALGLIPHDEAPSSHEKPKEGDDEVGERSKLPSDINPDAIHGKSFGVPDELKKMRIVRTKEFKMSDKFGGKNKYPVVWIIDPTGKIRKQWDGGASDHAIYGALVDFRRGGNGSGRPKSLPGERGGGLDWGFAAGLGFWAMLVMLGYLFCAFYHPMAFLMTVVFTNGTLPFNYVAGLGSIGRTQTDYLKTISVLIASGVVGIALSFFVNDVLMLPFPEIMRSIVSGVVSWWVLLYSLLVEAYALGRFYLRNKAALGWFD